MKAFLVLALLVPGLSWASNDEQLDIGKVVAEQQRIRSELSASSDSRGLGEAKRAELIARQESLLRMLDGKRSVDELDEAQRALVRNELEWIAEATGKRDEGRLVCKQERRIGSNRSHRVCRSAAQIEREREEARRQMSGACSPGQAGCGR